MTPTPRPASIATIISVTLPRPRTLALLRSREAFEFIRDASEALYGEIEARDLQQDAPGMINPK